MRRRRACAALLALHPWAAWSAPVAVADAREIRAVVEAQLAAFAADDAERAFSYAAPSIRTMFGTAEKFVAMVRQGYPVVYRPASVTFLVAETGEAGKLLQRLRMTDAAAAAWDVTYELERQPDRHWRITACVAVRARGLTT
jgi:hypothetical protein